MDAVDARPGKDHVVAFAAVQIVVPVAAREIVVARDRDLVVSRIADQRVVAVAAKQDVVPALALHPVIAGAAIQVIVALNDHIGGVEDCGVAVTCRGVIALDFRIESPVLHLSTLDLEDAMSTTLSIRIDAALERELKRAAKAAHRPKGDIVREALRRQLALDRFRAVRGEVLPLAEQSGFLTDEDVFKAIS